MAYKWACVLAWTLGVITACGRAAPAQPTTPIAASDAQAAPSVVVPVAPPPASAPAGDTSIDPDGLPIVQITPHAVVANVPGARVTVRPDRGFRAQGVRVRIDLPRLASARALATIRRTLARFFEEGVAEIGEASRARIACVAQIAQTNLVSYLCSYEGDLEGMYAYRFDAMTFTIDGDDARVIDAYDEIAAYDFASANDLVCSRARAPTYGCDGAEVLMALRPDGVVLFAAYGDAAPTLVETVVPFDRLRTLLFADGVAGRIPGAVAASREGRHVYAFERPEVMEAIAAEGGEAPYELLIGAPEALDVLARRLRDVERPVPIAPRADGLYQIVAAPDALAETRDLGTPRARTGPVTPYMALFVQPARAARALSLRARPDEQAEVTHVVPERARVQVLDGYVGEMLSDAYTPGGFVYVVAEAGAGYVLAGELTLQ